MEDEPIMLSTLWNCLKDGNFWIGVLVGVVLLGIVELVIVLVCECRRGVSVLAVKGEGGSMTVSRKALKSFLRNLVAREGAELQDFCLRSQKAGKFSLELVLTLTGNIPLDQVQKRLQEQVPRQLQAHMGIQDMISSVNLVFENLVSSSPAAEPEKKEGEEEKA